MGMYEATQAERLLAAAYLNERRHLTGDLAGITQCEITDTSTSGRCGEPASAVRVEDGFLDAVCANHAYRAVRRGARAIPTEEPS